MLVTLYILEHLLWGQNVPKSSSSNHQELVLPVDHLGSDSGLGRDADAMGSVVSERSRD